MAIQSLARAACLLLSILPARAAQIPGRYGFGAMVFDDSVENLFGRVADLCGTSSHNCNEIGSPNVCCPNTAYCFVSSRTTQVGCCSIGAACTPDPCKSVSGYLCTLTTTLTSQITTTTSCCTRNCSIGSFMCPTVTISGSASEPSCCPYGWSCQSTGGCSAPPGSSTTTPTSSVASSSLTACPTGQVACDNGANGCCDDSPACSTATDGQFICPPSDTPLSSSSSSLSAGAKAGLAIGTIAGVSFLGFLIYFICRKRQARIAKFANGHLEDDAVVSSTGRNTYTGPEAGVGPWTDTGAPPAAAGRFRPANRRGVSGQPQHAGDIMAPVEIDSSHAQAHRAAEAAAAARANHYHSAVPDTVEHRFELYGSEPVMEEHAEKTSTDSAVKVSTSDEPVKISAESGEVVKTGVNQDVGDELPNALGLSEAGDAIKMDEPVISEATVEATVEATSESAVEEPAKADEKVGEK